MSIDSITNPCMELPFKYVKNQCKEMFSMPDELSEESSLVNPMMLKFIKNQNREMCLKAVKKDGMALQFVKVQDYEIVSAAIKQNKKAAKFAEKKFKFH